MAELFCLCGDKQDVTAVKVRMNHTLWREPVVEKLKRAKVCLPTAMLCVKTGAEQMIRNPDTGDYHEHHARNVDIFECPNCHSRVAKE